MLHPNTLATWVLKTLLATDRTPKLRTTAVRSQENHIAGGDSLSYAT
jgi:hypothetical protein